MIPEQNVVEKHWFCKNIYGINVFFMTLFPYLYKLRELSCTE